jgi:two-component system phosphate regulon sensor histidine kinase PhoR
MFRSIRWRIAVTFAALIALCIVGLSAYLSYFFRHYYQDSLTTQLTDQAKLVGDAGEPYFVSGDTDYLDTLAKRLGEQIDARVTIIGRDGTVLGDSEEENPATMDNHSDRPEVRGALADGTGSDIRRSETLGYEMMYVAAAVTVQGETVGVARVSLPLTQIHAAMDHINMVIALGALIAAALGILLALQVTRITVDPVKKLTAVSKRMADGDLNQEIAVTSRDEVGELARAFNRMAVQVKQTMAAVTAERDRMEVIFSHMGDAILVVDGNSLVTTVNRAAEKVFQTSREQAIGRHFIEVVRDYEIDALLQRCLAAKEQQKGLVGVSPKRQLLGIIATPFQGDSGGVVLIQDLTELRRLETVRRDFISNLSHELRTPITSLKALTETLHQGAIDQPSVARDFVSKMNVEVDRLAQMVQEMGDLSRIESGEAPLKRSPVKIADVVARAVERLRAQADRAGLQMKLDIASGLPLASVDEGRMEQVLVNLIHNAIKFTPPGGRIDVTAKVDGDMLVVSVSDTGVGISADDLPRVFERFYKADRARGGGGTGLGLAIAKHVVEAHGGNIWVESVEGRGATFSFSIPLAS